MIIDPDIARNWRQKLTWQGHHRGFRDVIIDKDNVVHLQLKTKGPMDPECQFKLVEARESPCKHLGTPCKVDETLNTVSCGACGEKLNPIWVLAEFARAEGRWHRARERMVQERARYEKRSRTKCKHCGMITTISRN